MTIRNYMIIGVGLAALWAPTGCGGKKEDKKAPEPVAAVVPEVPKEAPKPAYSPEQLARGEYLVEKVMVCGACHTNIGPAGPDRDKHLGGGLEMTEVFGTWRAPNITADEETGLGKWTDAQIVAAIREGIRPNGDQLYPIMPYMFYRRLSDDDANAMVAYLRSVPAVKNTVAPSDTLTLGKPPAPTNERGPKDDSELAKGEYLGSLMKCGHCHFPMTEKGEPDMGRPFAGGMEFTLPMFGTGTIYAGNITSDKKTGIGDWSDEQVITALRTMVRPNGAPILPPMALFAPGWSQMDEGDLKAVAAWVKSIPPVENKVPTSTFKPSGPPPGAGAPGSGETPPAPGAETKTN